jgi:hypothetical protein
MVRTIAQSAIVDSNHEAALTEATLPPARSVRSAAGPFDKRLRRTPPPRLRRWRTTHRKCPGLWSSTAQSAGEVDRRAAPRRRGPPE